MSRAGGTDVAVREATDEDRLGVRRVLDAAMLDVREDLPARIAAGDVLVATDGSTPILGALVLVARESGAHVDAVAVRRARRGRGVGSALVRAAAERRDRLTAAFDPDVRPFYESLGFDVEPVTSEENRFRGTYESGSL
ncbi:GNAT family N-acetyltransferase [Halorussus halobius]|uniref:GNAT family N-acetyltransferase n=1 Tax=Halorussus halobius TaxID=1710537 RepID=UPI001091CDDE|nr:GNAT family N-acetyltransferase [Halorussus halobius]